MDQQPKYKCSDYKTVRKKNMEANLHHLGFDNGYLDVTLEHNNKRKKRESVLQN